MLTWISTLYPSQYKTCHTLYKVISRKASSERSSRLFRKIRNRVPDDHGRYLNSADEQMYLDLGKGLVILRRSVIQNFRPE